MNLKSATFNNSPHTTPTPVIFLKRLRMWVRKRSSPYSTYLWHEANKGVCWKWIDNREGKYLIWHHRQYYSGLFANWNPASVLLLINVNKYPFRNMHLRDFVPHKPTDSDRL